MSDQKKITAAVSAVIGYLQEEAAASVQAPREIFKPAVRSVPASPVSFWGMSGRQAQMQMRSMMQLKAFNRLR